jgi:ribonucleoside-diphosphate reductase alpha chain
MEAKNTSCLAACAALPPQLAVSVADVAQRVRAASKDGMSTADTLAVTADVASSLSSRHVDYSVLGSRLLLTALYAGTASSFSAYIEEMSDILRPELVALVRAHQQTLDDAIEAHNDWKYDFIGCKTLLRSYLLKKNGRVRERPQYLYMRVALGIHGGCIADALKSYHYMSNRLMTHATPTLYNAGLGKQQLASCFLLTMKADSIAGIYDTVAQCAQISKHAGGIGVAISNIRAAGSRIKGTQGTSSGIVPMLKVFNATAAYVDQAGRRKGGFAMYLEPWHADVEAFLDLKKNTGAEGLRARDLFYALWTPDLFMKRVKENQDWSLFCPSVCPELATTHGAEWEKLYESCEKRELATKVMPARKLWNHITATQIETGAPYMLFKDACNAKSNQQNLGTIRSSNLCAEVQLYTSPEEVAVCNLASISLPQFVENGKVNYTKLQEVVGHTVKSLDRVIDKTYYPVPEARVSNMRHRPIGIGVNGFHDLLFKLKLPWESAKAQETNKLVFETMYFAAMKASVALAKELGSYSSFRGSPLSQGKFQFDLWNVAPTNRYDWDALREEIQRHGARHSVMIALMPTASSAQIVGNCEGTDALTSNLYVRRVSSGEFVVMNKYLLRDLEALGLWTDEIRDLLIAHKGSVQKLPIPPELKELYKCAFEIKHKNILDMSIGRGPYVCQSQSMNLHIHNTTARKLTSSHFYAWRKGLKTGSYYVRTKSKVGAVQITVKPSLCETKEGVLKGQEECEMCGA